MELVFILVFLSLVVSLLAALISVLRGRRKKALWLATACAASGALYIAVVMTVAVLSRRNWERGTSWSGPRASSTW